MRTPPAAGTGSGVSAWRLTAASRFPRAVRSRTSRRDEWQPHPAQRQILYGDIDHSDHATIERLRQTHGEEHFYVAADDAMWYRVAAYHLLESMRIPYAQMHCGKAHLRVDGTLKRYSWRPVERTWFLILYDGENEPRLSSDVDLRQDIGRNRWTASR